MIETIWGRGYAKSPAYHWVADAGRSGLTVLQSTRELLDEVAMEASTRPEDLADKLLLEGLKTYRKMLWSN